MASSPAENNRAWLAKLERTLLALPAGCRTGSVTVHYTESGDGGFVRELSWDIRDKRLDLNAIDAVGSEM